MYSSQTKKDFANFAFTLLSYSALLTLLSYAYAAQCSALLALLSSTYAAQLCLRYSALLTLLSFAYAVLLTHLRLRPQLC